MLIHGSSASVLSLLSLLSLHLLLTDDILPTQVWSTCPHSRDGPSILGREAGPRVPVDVDLSEMEGEAGPLPGKASLCDEGTQMLTELLAKTSWNANAPVTSTYSEASVSSCSSWLMGNISKKVFLITNAHLGTLRACKAEEGPTTHAARIRRYESQERARINVRCSMCLIPVGSKSVPLNCPSKFAFPRVHSIACTKKEER
mmetsp:Transcript_6082/g.17024  ORF Transcript_6082/g.17024 Transcript_6082/m.17024 type:complete len:202 (-) Transcript_6082:9-614(-)